MTEQKQKFDMELMFLREFSLNYENQYPNEVPDINLVVNIIGEEK